MKLLIILFSFVQVTAFAQNRPGPSAPKNVRDNFVSERSAVEAEVKDPTIFEQLTGIWGGLGKSAKDVEVQTVARLEQHENQKANINEATIDYIDGNLSCINPNLTCLSISNEKSEVRNYKKDLDVCNCLESRFDLPIKDLSEMTPKELEEKNMRIEEGKLYASLMELKKKFVAKRDSLLLEAHFVSKNQVETMLEIGQTEEATRHLKDMVASYKGKVSPKVYEEAFNMVDNHYSTADTVLDNLNKATKRPDSCFPFADYLKVSMLPNQKVFWKSLLDNKDIKKEDWDYYDLINRYNANKEDRREVKAKLDFLNKNPTLKAIFTLGDEETKKRAYKEMRNALNPNSSCVKKGNCRSQFFAKGGDLQKALKNIYEDPKVKEMTIGITYVDTLTDISGIHNTWVDGLSVPALRMAYANGNATYDNCDTNTFHENAPACGEIFQNYCTELYARKDEMLHELESKEVNASYSNDWLDDMEAEPSNNPGYQKFQNKMCQRLARKYPGSSKVMNFQAFKENYCPQNEQECNSLDDSGLFKLFISKTEATNKVFDDNQRLVEDDEGMHVLAEANSENKTSVSEFNQGTLARVKNSNKLSTFGKPSEEDSVPMSIMDLIGKVGNETKPKLEEKSNVLEPLEKISVVDTVETIDEGFGFFTGDNLTEDFFNKVSPGNQGLLGNNTYMDSAISEARNELNELKKEEEAIKNEMMQVKDEISATPSSGSNRELELRLENLEKLLAEKEKTSQNYQGLISKLMEAQTSPKVAKEATSKTTDYEETANKAAGIEATRKSAVSAVISNKPTLTEEQNSSQRAPASVENFNTSSGMGGGGAAASVAMSTSSSQAARGGGRFNGALLSKYGIMVQENPGSSVSVAQEVEGSRFQTMGVFKEASNIPLEVSQKAFERFKVNDLSALQELYKESLEKIDEEVVKILVSSEESKETLEFYAIKEDGKVVFQPIRKNKLSDLQNTLSHY